ncbi:putative acetyltransferase [Pseudovibrio axinellae]|uniref:Putative acetyltransferase n=1 Tax=Pseudovibrio axinellae TaxID=989403 RepID=A0A161V6W5_9HYPH|nr:GNAT family N-acetyltransferase [Pseudovibrio axinellae]KZL20651.1 putative acetyltransferase [Pseudovibrio axinellae]SER26779.1 Acetyltransferase (GNAT) family protein [Pseudovibrio axinellae]
MQTLEIRSAHYNELPAVARMYRHSRDRCLSFLPNRYSPKEDLWYFQNVVFESCELINVISDGQIIGMMATQDDWIEQLYLDPTHLRKGIGSELLSQAKAKSSGKLRLMCFVENSAARSFYEVHGFKEVKRTSGSENEEGAPDILYEWRA